MPPSQESKPSQRRSSFKPLVEPPPHALLARSTAADRRKSLVRGICKPNRIRRRVTSLSKDEEDFLAKVASTGDKATATKDADVAASVEETQAARSGLLECVEARRSLLTDKEASFLSSLAERPDVSADDLTKCNQVLQKDPLYNVELVSDGEVARIVRRPTLPNDASYRIELWTRCACPDGLRYSGRSDLRLIQGEGPRSEKESQPTLSSKQGSKEKKKNPFAYFWHRILLRGDDDDDESESKEIDDGGMEKDNSLSAFSILGTGVDDIASQPHVLSPPIMDALRPHMPFCVQQDNFWLKYSLLRDGASLTTLLSKVRNSARTVLAIETTDGHVLGSFTSSPWRAESHYYGSGEAFLWRLLQSRYNPCSSVEDQVQLESEVDVYGWTGQNRNVQFACNKCSELRLGGGGPVDEVTGVEQETQHGFGLVLNSDLSKGTSDSCVTFGNPISLYGKDSSFGIANLEVWAMTPVEFIEHAEQLELGRQFVFDHGNYVVE